MNKLQQKDKVEILLAIYALASFLIYLSAHSLGKMVLTSSFSFLLFFYAYYTVSALWKGLKQQIKPLSAIAIFFIHYNALMALLCSLLFVLFIPGSQVLMGLGLVSSAAILTIAFILYLLFRKNNALHDAMQVVVPSFPRMIVLFLLCALLKSTGMVELYKMCGPFRKDAIYMKLMQACVEERADCSAFSEYHTQLQQKP